MDEIPLKVGEILYWCDRNALVRDIENEHGPKIFFQRFRIVELKGRLRPVCVDLDGGEHSGRPFDYAPGHQYVCRTKEQALAVFWEHITDSIVAELEAAEESLRELRSWLIEVKTVSAQLTKGGRIPIPVNAVEHLLRHVEERICKVLPALGELKAQATNLCHSLQEDRKKALGLE